MDIVFAYLITNKVTGKKYVGVAKNTAKRWRQHVSNARSARLNSALHQAILKHGEDNFEFEVIACSTSREDIAKTECALIAQYACKAPNGYNLTNGGDGLSGLAKTPEHKAKIGNANRGRKLSPQHIAKIRLSRIGSKRSAETKRKMKALQSTESYRLKISEIMRGKKLSDETKLKMSKSRKGIKRWTDEQRAAIGMRRRMWLSDPNNKISALKNLKQFRDNRRAA